jgi:competence protein ComEA
MALNLNQASEKEIASAVPEIGQGKARSLVEYRNQKGNFKSWDDLKRVPGFSDEVVDMIKQKGAMM